MNRRAREAAGTRRGSRRRRATGTRRPCGPAADAAAVPQQDPPSRSLQPPQYSLIVHPALDESELDDRQRHDQDKEHDRFGARESELEILEGVEVDAVDERAG